MIQNTLLPHDLLTVLGSEKREFAVKAGRANPTKRSLFVIVFGLAWLGFSSIFVAAFLGPLFFGNEVHFESNGVPTVASPDNLGPIVVPALIIGVFVLIGLIAFLSGIYLLLKKGGYFVGTPTRLVHYHGGRVRSIDWEQFTGDIEVKGNAEKGNLALQLRTGRMVSNKNKPARYVPDTIYMAGIPEPFKVEQVCRKRIKENDPTPAATAD